MASSLEALPPELLDNIARCCLLEPNNNTLFNLRLACRSIEVATRRIWRAAFFTARYLDLDVVKLGKLTQIGAVRELARTTTALVVRCKDDSKQLSSEIRTSQPSAELMNLSFVTVLALQKFRNVHTIKFEPTPSGVRDDRDEDGDTIIDFSHTFSFVLLAAQACGLRLLHIVQDRKKAILSRCDFKLTNVTNMLQLSDCFSDLQSLEVGIEAQNLQTHPQLAKHLASSIHLMRSLTSITLDFGLSNDVNRLGVIFAELANSVHLPHVVRMDLIDLACYVQDLTHFLVKHASTLTECMLRCTTLLESDAITAVRILLETLRDALHLEHLRIIRPEYSDGTTFSFPNIDRTYVSRREAEDGFLLVKVRDGMKFVGVEEVRDGLAAMLSCIVVDV